MTRTRTFALTLAAALSLTACTRHDGNTTDATANSDVALNETVPADDTGLSGNGDTLNAGDPTLGGNDTDLNAAAPVGNTQ